MKIEYKGETYCYRNGVWLDESYLQVPISLMFSLNQLLMKKENFYEKSVGTLVKLGDDAKEHENHELAIYFFKTAISKGDGKQAARILPRLASSYRLSGKAQEGIDVANAVWRKYGDIVVTPLICTSVAASYLDLGDTAKAKKNADKAYALSCGKGGAELHKVYARIEKMQHMEM